MRSGTSQHPTGENISLILYHFKDLPLSFFLLLSKNLKWKLIGLYFLGSVAKEAMNRIAMRVNHADMSPQDPTETCRENLHKGLKHSIT